MSNSRGFATNLVPSLARVRRPSTFSSNLDYCVDDHFWLSSAISQRLIGRVYTRSIMLGVAEGSGYSYSPARAIPANPHAIRNVLAWPPRQRKKIFLSYIEV